MVSRIGVLPAVLLLGMCAWTFSAPRTPNLRSHAFRPLKVTMKIEPPQERQFEVIGGEGSRKPPVRQLILLDGVLLAAAFIINLKCARKLHGMLSPEAFWGRLFVWIWWNTLELGLFWCFICEFPPKLWLQWPDLYRRHTRSFDFHLYSRFSWHFISLRISIPLQSATRVENRSRKQEMDTKDCTECSFCVTVLLYCCVPNGKLDIGFWQESLAFSELFWMILNAWFSCLHGSEAWIYWKFLYEVWKEMRLETSSWMLIVYEKFKPKSVNTSQTSNSQRGCN